MGSQPDGASLDQGSPGDSGGGSGRDSWDGFGRDSESPEADEVEDLDSPQLGLELSEILADPSAEQGGGDWVEIHNPLDVDVPLAGWRLTDDPDDNGDEFADTILEPGAFLTVAATGDSDAEAGAHAGAVDFKLDADGEYLALIDPQGRIVDAWSPGFPLQYEGVSYGRQMRETAEGIEVLDGARFFLVPTPGAVNGTAVEDLGPVISDPGFNPTQPTESDDVVVTARIADGFGTVDAAQLTVRVGFGPEFGAALLDDGTGGDTVAGDGVFTATLSTEFAGPGELLRWAIRATNAEGHSSRWPLYVDREGESQSEAYLGTVIADPSVSSALPVYELFVEDASRMYSRAGTRGSLFYDEELYDNVFVRLRGDSTTTLPKQSNRIDFDREHAFRLSNDHERILKVDLDAQYIDPSYLRNVLAMESYREAGGVAPLSFPVRLQLNGAFEGLRIFVEHIDADFMEREGLDPDGALYKAPLMLNLEPWDGRDWSEAEKKTRLDEDFSDLEALVLGVYPGNSVDERERYLYDHVDLPAVINYLAVFVVLGDGSGITGNYYMWRDSEGTGEWRVIPWDRNYGFGQLYGECRIVADEDDNFSHPFHGSEDHQPTGWLHYLPDYFNRLHDAVIEVPSTRQMLLRRMRSVMDMLLDPPGTAPVDAHYETRLGEWSAAMAPDALLDRALWGDPNVSWYCLGSLDMDGGIAQITDEYLPLRRAHLYATHNRGGAAIPAAQDPASVLEFGDVRAEPLSGDPDEQFVELINPGAEAVDVSGWRLGGDVTLDFAAGTVVASGQSLYVAPLATAFRSRPTSPTGDEGRLVQAGWQGSLSVAGGELQLTDGAGAAVATTSY